MTSSGNVLEDPVNIDGVFISFVLMLSDDYYIRTRKVNDVFNMVAEVSGFADILYAFTAFLMSFYTPKLKQAFLLKKLISVSPLVKS